MPGFLVQAKGFGVSLVIGFLGGWTYDLYRVVFHLLRWRTRVSTAFGDGLFWLGFTILACISLFVGSAGEVRFYTFGGMFVGFLLYRRVFHRCVVTTANHLGIRLLRPLCAVKRLVSWIFQPLRRLRVWRRHRKVVDEKEGMIQ